MYIKRINKEINENSLNPEYKEKNIQWFKAFDQGGKVILFEDEENDYYSLLTVIKEGIDNSIPVPVFEDITGVDAKSVAEFIRTKTDYYNLKERQQNMEVICEQPLFTLTSSSYNGIGETIHITATMLKLAEVGTMWEVSACDCGRDLYEESLEIIYKTDKGCACLYRRWGTTDSSEPEEWEKKPKLIWFELL